MPETRDVKVHLDVDTGPFVGGMERAFMAAFWGLPVVVVDWLPVEPSFGEQIRRRVRHGLADVLAWCGEDVGPKPEAATHAFTIPGVRLYVSQDVYDQLRRIARESA